jgi:hypothetical protein
MNIMSGFPDSHGCACSNIRTWGAESARRKRERRAYECDSRDSCCEKAQRLYYEFGALFPMGSV